MLGSRAAWVLNSGVRWGGDAAVSVVVTLGVGWRRVMQRNNAHAYYAAEAVFVVLLVNFGVSAAVILGRHTAGKTSIIGLLSNTFLVLGKVYGFRTIAGQCMRERIAHSFFEVMPKNFNTVHDDKKFKARPSPPVQGAHIASQPHTQRHVCPPGRGGPTPLQGCAVGALQSQPRRNANEQLLPSCDDDCRILVPLHANLEQCAAAAAQQRRACKAVTWPAQTFRRRGSTSHR